MPIFLIGLLALLGLGAGVAVASRKNASTQSPPYGQYTPPTTTLPTTTTTFPTSPTTTFPASTTTEQTYFDIRQDGTRIWKEPYRTQILQSLLQWGIAFFAPNDPTTVQLVPRQTANDATAAQWVEKYKTRTILAARWMIPNAPLPAGTPLYLRAVPPGEETPWAGAGQTGLYGVLQSSQEPKPQQNVPSAPQGQNLPPPPPAPVQPDAFSGLPTKIQNEARRAMRDERNPETLTQIADAIDGSSDEEAYTTAAAALRQRAKELRAEIEVTAIKEHHTHVLRKSNGGVELASVLAQHYTGNANAWRDLPATNKHVSMRVMKGEGQDGAKIEYLHPWKVGQRVILPPSWDTSKGLPPIA